MRWILLFIQFREGLDMSKLQLFISVFILPFLSSCTSLVVDNSAPYPELQSAPASGYVEMWVPTSFGMWLKDLEQGPTTCDNIEVTAPGMEKDTYLCVVQQLSWPAMAGHVGLSSLKYRPIADNFSACRFAMPEGKHSVYIRPGVNCYPEKFLDKYRAGGYAVPGMLVTEYKTPVFVSELDIKSGRLHNYMLHVALAGEDVHFYLDEANVTLPIPPDPTMADPDPNAFSDLVKMLDAEIWGFRWYAARRLGFIGNPAAIPVLKKKLEQEKHKDVRNEMQKALERLGV
jgi:hypothetical protein